MQIAWKEKISFYIYLCIMLGVTLVVQDEQVKEGLIVLMFLKLQFSNVLGSGALFLFITPALVMVCSI